jgi:hypothetical protein
MNKKIAGRRRRPSLDNLYLNFNSSIMETVNKQVTYDKTNAIYIVWVAYKYKWVSNATNAEVSSMNYYLRFANDKNYAGNQTEINRLVNFLVERLSLDYMEQGNPIERVILYRNTNRGNSIKNVKNPELWRIELKNGFMEKRATIEQKNMNSEHELKGWTNLLHEIEEYSKSQKAELAT